MTEISNNSILFIGLANEYCQTLEVAQIMRKTNLSTSYSNSCHEYI